MKKILFCLLLLMMMGPVFAETVSFPINPPREYDFKNKKEIFSVRKKMLKKYPIFFSGKYEPTGPVFARIEDGKPWWGLQGIECKGPGNNSIDGASEESRFIDNPFLLIGIDQATVGNSGANARCAGNYPKPSNLKLDTEKKAFSVIYSLVSSNALYTFAARNALDFGAKYAYADEVTGIEFTQPDNVSTMIYEFRDFIHVGNSCGYVGGCNNGSPAQQELDFRVPKGKGSIHFKLWKKKPDTKEQPADMTFEIRIR
ncbi:MAG: hypothetical protein J6Y03_06405 [Alphaproteobacteria bacterium]|nr:hypothetical protein [Alphaproteobacteria bacterium]